MVRQWSSRGQRSKGIKIKHVIQITLFLSVLLWLMYRVKHSYDEKREVKAPHEEITGMKLSTDTTLKLGRKDLPQVDDKAQHEGDEEEDEEEKEEEAESGKHRKVEDTGRKPVRNKDEEIDAGEKGSGADADDEIDERDDEKPEEETFRERDFFDEEKEREEVDADEKKDDDQEDGDKNEVTSKRFGEVQANESNGGNGGGRLNSSVISANHSRGNVG